MYSAAARTSVSRGVRPYFSANPASPLTPRARAADSALPGENCPSAKKSTSTATVAAKATAIITACPAAS